MALSSGDPEAPDPGVALMLAYQRGDEGAFDRLVELHAGQVFALLTRFLGPVEEREDLVQEVFLRVIRARSRYVPTARFSTWLYRIAFNLCANRHERAPARRFVPLEPGSADASGERDEHDLVDERAPEPWSALAREDAVSAVRAAIAELPEKQRLALVLARYEELPLAEIAHVLDSTEQAVKSLVHRARETLRRRLAPFLQEELA